MNLSLLIIGVVGLFIVYLIINSLKSNEKQQNLEKEKSIEKLKNETRDFIEEIKVNKKLIPIQSSMLLDMGENAFLKDNEVSLFETRAVRKHSGVGASFHIAKGVRIGGYEGQSQSHQQMKMIDFGEIVITNKRFLFKGNQESRAIPLSKIIDMSITSEYIEISQTNRQKKSIFKIRNPYLCHLIIYVIRNVQDPLDFSELQKIEINVP